MKQTILDKNELEYFFVEESYGGNQDLFPDVTMRDGGCGAIAACESCIFIHISRRKSVGKNIMILHM